MNLTTTLVPLPHASPSLVKQTKTEENKPSQEKKTQSIWDRLFSTKTEPPPRLVAMYFPYTDETKQGEPRQQQWQCNKTDDKQPQGPSNNDSSLSNLCNPTSAANATSTDHLEEKIYTVDPLPL